MALAPSSPRLPSPPPAAEIQIGPKSPSGDGAAGDPLTTKMEQSLVDANAKRRIHPGTKSCDMAAGPPLVPLNELDSAFQLQEHLAALHHQFSDGGVIPINRETALELAQPPAGIDRTLWLYELCRFLISQCNSLIVGFLFDTPACSATTCPEMRASEWQFLCAVHEQPKSCCAIDYCCHTLDWAANVVTDQKLFPSRFVVLSDPQSKNVGVKNLVNVFRRLHRIFAHAWFQHRSVFWSVEGQTGLYVFFKTVCDLYDLLPAENYKLPPEAEGIEEPQTAEPEEQQQQQQQQQQPTRPTPTILKPPSRGDGDDDEDPASAAARSNTRRHIRSSPSTGSAVTTVLEAEEEEPDSVADRVKALRISTPEVVSDDPEVADVPMMVEDSMMTPSASTHQEKEETKEEEAGADATKQEAEPEAAEEPKPDAEEPASDDTQVTTETPDPPSKDTPSSDATDKDTSDKPTATEASSAEEGTEAATDTKAEEDTKKEEK